MALPLQQTTNADLSLLQTKWKAQLDPILALALLAGQVLPSQQLVSGTNAINHKLGRKLQGWYIVRRRQFKISGTATAYDIYDVQDNNQTPQTTLKLTCSQGTPTNPVIVDIYVF
jgi:hypothetical protein